MGAIFSWIIRGLAYAGPAAVGYFFNDVATWFASLIPNTKVTDSSGRFIWWFVLIIIAIIGAVILFVLNMFGGKKKLFALAGMALCYAADYFLPGITLTGFDIIAAGVLGVIPASSTDSFSIDFCPETLVFESADFSSFRIEVKEDGQIFSLDTDGLANLQDIGFVGNDTLLAHNGFRIANGFVTKTTTFTGTNTNVAARTIRGFSMGKAVGGPHAKGLYHTFNTTKAFANVEFRMRDFSFISFPTAGLTDNFTIHWRNGTSDNLNANELRVLLASTQFPEGVSVDNRRQIISEIRFTGTVDQSVYYTKFKAVL